MASKVTDPALLEQLNSAPVLSRGPRAPVSDPALLHLLNGGSDDDYLDDADLVLDDGREVIRDTDERAGLPIPGTVSEFEAEGGDTSLRETRRFGLGRADTLNPLPAVAALGDQYFREIPILGPYLGAGRDKLNAAIYGGTPEEARADIAETVRQNPTPATIGAIAGQATPYVLGATNPVTAGTLGLRGTIGQRIGMTLGSQYAISTGDQLAEGKPLEQAALKGAVDAAAAAPFAAFGMSPAIRGTRGEAIQILEREGIPLTGGQARGSKGLTQFESQTGGTSAMQLRDDQLAAFTKASLRRAGVNADNAGPEVMRNAFKAAGDKFDDLASRTTVAVDQQLQDDLLKAVTDYEDVAGQSVPVLQKMVNRVGEIAQKNGNQLSGNSYRVLATDLREAMERASNGDVKTALGSMIEALNDAVERSATGALKDEWRVARQQYANLATVADAVKGAGDYAAQGLVTPESLRTAIASRNPRNYVKGYGDLNELARAGVIAMPRLPDSGTASRLAPYIMAQGGVGHYLATQDAGPAALMALGGAVAPSVLGKLALSGPGRSFLRDGSLAPSIAARAIAPTMSLEQYIQGKQN